MSYSRSDLFRASSIYVLGNALAAAIPFVLLPLLTRYLGQEAYGTVSMFQVLTASATPVVGLSVYGSIINKYFALERTEFGYYVGNCLLILATTAVLALGILYCTAPVIERYTGFPGRWLWSVVALVGAQFICTVLLLVWQAQNRAFLYGSFLFCQTAFNGGISILFVVYFGWGWQGRVMAQVAAAGLFAILALVSLRREGFLAHQPNSSHWYSALRFGLPLVPHGLAGVASVMAGRVILSATLGLAATGLFTVGYQIGSVVMLLLHSVNQAYVPWLYHGLRTGTPDSRVRIVRITYALFAVAAALTCAVSLGCIWFGESLLGSNYREAVAYVPWVASACALDGAYRLLSGFLFYTEKTGWLACVTTTSALAHIPISLWLIERNGAIGAAQALVLVNLLMFAATWWLANRVMPMPWALLSANPLVRSR